MNNQEEVNQEQIVKQNAKIVELERENTFLREQLKLIRAQMFGRSSERRVPEVSPAQMLLFTSEEVVEKNEVAEEKQKVSYERRKKNSIEGKLPEGVRFPEHLPREEEIIDEGGPGEIILEKITERLAAKESAFYVKRIIRKVRKEEGEIKQPATPPAVLEKTSVDVTFLVWMLKAKFEWHLPIYRQEQMLKSSGINLSRDSMIRYVISIAGLLKPIYTAIGSNLLTSCHLYADETPVLVGKNCNGIKKYTNSYFWGILGEDGVMFRYTATRAYAEVEEFFKNFKGNLQVDAYGVYEKLSAIYPDITLVSCWAHARRKFVDAEKGGNSELAKDALTFISQLYDIERECRENQLSPPEVLKLRQQRSTKILDEFHKWLKLKASDPSILPKCLFAKAVYYALVRWDALCTYTTDPKLSIDSNTIEQKIRPIALGKKNWLFCDSETGAESAAIIYSLMASCKLANINTWDYLVDVLVRISEHPASKVHELIPAKWKKTLENQKIPILEA